MAPQVWPQPMVVGVRPAARQRRSALVRSRGLRCDGRTCPRREAPIVRVNPNARQQEIWIRDPDGVPRARGRFGLSLAVRAFAAAVAAAAVVTLIAASAHPAPPSAAVAPPAPALGLWSHRFVETPRGRVVAVAFSRAPAGVAMVRYHASGRLDRAFRKVVLRGFGAGSLDTLAAGVDGAGRIVVAACAPPDCWGAFVLGRLLRRGTLDASFGRGGTARTAVPGRALAPRALAVARGTIAVAGEASAGASRALFIARYGPDGRPDERFGGRGVLVDDALGGAGAVALDDRGRIVVAGDGYVARFDARGARDRTFGNGGLTGVAELLAPRALLLDSRRRIVVGGSAHPRQRPRLAVVRLLASGRSDRHFGTGGTALDRRPGDHWSRIEALLPLADGLLAVGWATRGGAVQTRRYRIVAIRLDDRGRLRRTYGDRGRVTVARFEAQARAAFRAGRAALVVGPDDDLRPRAIRFARLPLR